MNTSQSFWSRWLLPIGVLGFVGSWGWTVTHRHDPLAQAQAAALSARPAITGYKPHQHAWGQNMVLHAHTTRLALDSAPTTPSVGQPATWTLRVLDRQTNAPLSAFEVQHQKLMHLIVVSDDLTWFRHAHPVFRPDGTFTISETLPRAGGYHVFADYVPQGRDNEVGQDEVRAVALNTEDSQASGKPTLTSRPVLAPTRAHLVPDVAVGECWCCAPIKRVQATAEDAPVRDVSFDTYGKVETSGRKDIYEVALAQLPPVIHAGEDALLRFQVRNSDSKPLTDLQPYLGAMGHAVTISEDARTYLHIHPISGDQSEMMRSAALGEMSPQEKKLHAEHLKHLTGLGKKAQMEGPAVEFHTQFPGAGRYKVWGQFRHNGRIITAPFVVYVEPALKGAKRVAAPSPAGKRKQTPASGSPSSATSVASLPLAARATG